MALDRREGNSQSPRNLRIFEAREVMQLDDFGCFGIFPGQLRERLTGGLVGRPVGGAPANKELLDEVQ